MEVTSIITVQITQIEDGKSDNNALPFGAEEKSQLPEIIREKLDCDNIVVKSLKQFSIDKGDCGESKEGSE